MRKPGFIIAALMVAILVAPSTVPAKNYKIDAEHTSVRFRVRHLFTKTDGQFKTFEGKIVYDVATPAELKVTGSIDVGSIDTNVKERDNHLRSKDFFDVANHPKITFESTSVSDIDAKANTGKLHGKLTLRGVTKDIVLDVAFTGEGSDPWGNHKAGFTAATKIDRKEFGLTWNETLETGGVLVGDEIEIQIDAEAYVE
jgi:polyisoprenoid-binding protein YceI